MELIRGKSLRVYKIFRNSSPFASFFFIIFSPEVTVSCFFFFSRGSQLRVVTPERKVLIHLVLWQTLLGFQALSGVHSWLCEKFQAGQRKTFVPLKVSATLQGPSDSRGSLLGLSRLCSATFEQLLAFGATFCGFSNLEQVLPFRAIFEQNIGLEHISSTKKSTISWKTSIHANFLKAYHVINLLNT